MTEILYDRSFDTDMTSSVIDSVYYSTEQGLLFVELVRTNWDGTTILAGYANVPENVFTAMELINQKRLDGDGESSVGSYWNTWIKPHFPGYSTADVELVSQADLDRREKLSRLVNPVRPEVQIIEAKSMHIMPIDAGLEQYGITFKSIGSNQTTNFRVKATDMHDVIARFRQVEKILGWDEAEVLSITKFLA